MIEKYYDSEKNILYVKNFGRLDFEAMKAYFVGLSEHVEQTKSLFVLEDAREGDVHFNIKHISDLSNVLSGVSAMYNHVHHAVLLENAKNVAYAMLINDGISKGDYKLKVFFNEHEAEKWLSPN
jgi:nitrate reductase NapAB chaperone NapD